MRDRLKDTLPRIAQKMAQQWAETCADEDMTDILRELRTARGSDHDDLLADLRYINTQVGRQGGW